MIKLFFLSVKCRGLQYRCLLGTISIGVGCKEGGAAWGAVSGDPRERCCHCYGRCIARGNLFLLFYFVMFITEKVRSDLHVLVFFRIQKYHPFLLDKGIAIPLCPGSYIVTEGDRRMYNLN